MEVPIIEDILKVQVKYATYIHFVHACLTIKRVDTISQTKRHENSISSLYLNELATTHYALPFASSSVVFTN